MTEDLLTSIQQQLEERIEELRGAVEEHDRLQADLDALGTEPTRLDANHEASNTEVVFELEVDPLALEAEPVTQEDEPQPRENVLSFPVRQEPAPAHARTVSPKVARLMFAPRRPSLERSGIPRVSESADVSQGAPVDEGEAQLELYEQAI
jgi:hypothetical protein